MKPALFIAACLLAHDALAGCSRDIAAPVSANGASVIVEGTTARGIYPDLLRNLGPKAGCNFVWPRPNIG